MQEDLRYFPRNSCQEQLRMDWFSVVHLVTLDLQGHTETQTQSIRR